MRSGITRRWLRGSLLITVLLVLLVEVMFLYSATRSYYNGVQQTMYRRFSSITGQLKMYTGETSQKTAASRSVALRRMVEQFSDKDKYEFMLLDSYGGVIASSSGTDAEGIVTRTDFFFEELPVREGLTTEDEPATALMRDGEVDGEENGSGNNEGQYGDAPEVGSGDDETGTEGSDGCTGDEGGTTENEPIIPIYYPVPCILPD